MIIETGHVSSRREALGGHDQAGSHKRSVSSKEGRCFVLKKRRVVIGVIRFAAVVVLVFALMALWNFMLWLPWQVDCVIAGTAAMAFAYRFERGSDNGM